MSYGIKIKTIRKSLKLSQRALGELIGKTRDIVNSWERGTARVPAEEWDKINLLALKQAQATGTDKAA